MKSIFLILFLGLVLLKPCLAQEAQDRTYIQELVKQSEKQRSTGLKMMAFGGGAVALGLLLAASSDDWTDGAFGGGILLAGAGSLTALIGIPVLAGSANKARRAASLSITTARLAPVQSVYRSSGAIPSLTFSLPLNSKNR